MLIQIICLILVFAINGVVVASEFSIVRTPKYELTALINARKKQELAIPLKLKYALEMANNKGDYLSTTQILITLTVLILGVIGEGIFNVPLKAIGVPANIASPLALVLMTYLNVVLTELFPKNIAIADPMKVDLFVAIPLHLAHILLYPFVAILNGSANLLTKLAGYKNANEVEDTLNEKQLLQLVKLSSASDSSDLDVTDFSFIDHAIKMGNKKVSEIGVPAKYFVKISNSQTLYDGLRTFSNDKINRILVTENDKIIGYLYLYDLLAVLNKDHFSSLEKTKSLTIKEAMVTRKLIVEKETMPIIKLFSTMNKRRTSIALIVSKADNQPLRLITTKDISEELFGEITTEDVDVDEQNGF